MVSESKKFGDLLRRFRSEKAKTDSSFSPSNFAALVNISQVAQRRAEEDGLIPNTDTIRKMADILDIQPENLLIPAGQESFAEALPVWPRGRREKMNDFVLFSTCFPAEYKDKIFLKITGSTYFRVKLNGQFISHGPMRGPKGYFRISELPLAVHSGENRLEIEVSGANINSFDFMDQPSFLQAEVRCGNRILAATGRNFLAFDLSNERIQKVSRYSYQRLFFEAYRMRVERKNLNPLELEICPPVNFLPSRMHEPKYKIDKSFQPVKTLRRSYVNEPLAKMDRSVTLAGKEGYKGFPEQELEVNAYSEIPRYRLDDNGTIISTLYRGKTDNTGFIKIRVVCHQPGRLVVLYDELESPDGGVNPLRLYMTGGVFFDLLEPGEYDLETIEPGTLKFAEVFMHSGKAEILDFSLREYKNPLKLYPPSPKLDKDLKKIYRAGLQSFAANAVDLFTDCPSRERAGWLTDAFFIARASFFLTGSTIAEKCFLENFLLAPPCPGIPEAIFPMEYPGDHTTGEFIPNWGMWLLLQLGEYAQRSNDRCMAEDFRKKVFAFIDYIDRFQNSDGLLEKLPSWVFVEWSKANCFVQDVNYPINMLYARTLEVMAELYNIPEWNERAQTMRQTILEQSFDGQFFRDHAERKEDGTLNILPDTTEVCQYYAFYFGTATVETHSALWHCLVGDFGTQRDTEKKWEKVYPVNMFMGAIMRLELLIQTGQKDLAAETIKEYCLKMAKLTGTLWEHKQPYASCCHGFQSFICCLLHKIKEEG
ncbi:MAG: hypothetical protein E7057_03155 [Lentisphaerae bacterium]|nr:hypothetical protein [Lentisphaerota bacterium]